MQFCLKKHFYLALLLASASCWAQTDGAAPAASAGAPSPPTVAPAYCEIFGHVISGKLALPGVAISAANSLTGKKISSSTDLDGSFLLQVPPKGRYIVRAELAAFAPATKEIVINATNCRQQADLDLTLLSRVQTEQGTQTAAAGAAQRQRGFQNLAVSTDMSAFPAGGDQGGQASANSGGDATMAGLPSIAQSADAATESVSVSGASGQTNDAMFGGNNPDLQQRIQELRDRAERGELPGGFGGGGPGGGFGGPGGGGGFGGGGQIIRIGGGGRGRFNLNKPHGSLYYSVDDAAFDASPYSLTGLPTTKPDYIQHRFGATLGGPLKIPKIYDGGTTTFFFLNYTGNRSENPYDVFSTVPTLAERSGNFSQVMGRTGQPVQIFDPATGLPFAGDTITNINPAAQALLQYIPVPNLPGSTQNFHYVTTATNNMDNISLRLVHNFGASNTSGIPGIEGGVGGGGGRGGGGRRSRNNLNIGFTYHHGNSVLANPFPSVLGNSKVQSFDVPVGYVRSKGHWTNNARVDFNRSTIRTSNLYSGVTDVAGQAGINGVSTNPFDWGIPALQFTTISGIRDVNPVRQRNQTLTFSDFVAVNHGKHNVRFGGDYRRIQLNNQTDSNARGTYIFTGLFTSGGIPGGGLDFADFLLGMPQQASVQYGENNYHFRGDAWSLYVQDDWRLRSNLTINAGVRYEYFSPYSEINNFLANLDVNPTFTSAVPVLPGQVGPITGAFPSSLIDPDRNNFAPRVGIAWKAFKNTVVRSGYGINYNTGQYASMVQQLAFQPPFDTTATNIATLASPLPLQNAFPVLAADTTTNTYGVDRNYRLGYVQIWNLNIQQEIKRSFVLNVDYTGTKGTHLDILRAPNRDASGGLRIPGVQPFLWESSDGNSIMHAGSVRLRKRLQHGLGLGATYIFSKSIDNASSIGGGATVVAQNDQDLAAERGLSSFDQRHKFTGDWTFDLPFGENRRWFSGKGGASRVLGGWQYTGSFTIASGLPFTARVLGDFADVSQGVNGTLRADTTGQPIQLAHPTLTEFFNTAAFVVPPLGQFGDSGRNTITGPSTVSVNMAISKTIQIGDTKALECRAQASNVFNTPQWTGLDTVVNSPTFGHVISVGAMRRIQFLARFRF